MSEYLFYCHAILRQLLTRLYAWIVLLLVWTEATLLYFLFLEVSFWVRQSLPTSPHSGLSLRFAPAALAPISHTGRTTFSHTRITLYPSRWPCKCHNNVSTVCCGMPGTPALPSPQAIFPLWISFFTLPEVTPLGFGGAGVCVRVCVCVTVRYCSRRSIKCFFLPLVWKKKTASVWW